MATTHYKKIATLENHIEAQLIQSILNENGISHRIFSYHDTAYDGLFQFQRGWGEIQALAEYKDDILSILNDIRKDLPQLDE